jgi:hypothetical protein
MKSLSASFAKACLWGSLCIFAFPLVSLVAERAPTQSKIWTTQQERQQYHVVAPVRKDRREHLFIRKLLPTTEWGGLFELESDLQNLV